MVEPLEAAVAELQKKLQEQEGEVIQTKKMINQLCGYMNKRPLHDDAELQTSKTNAVRADEYYGKAAVTAMREVLQRRQHIGPAKAREIYDALIEGGYDGFRTEDEQNRLTGMRISLRKASKVFHKLPNGQCGLVDWYDNIRKQKAEAKHGDKGNGSPSRTSVAAESSSGKQEGQSSDCPSLSNWSGQPDSNWRPSPWQGDALPTELCPQQALNILAIAAHVSTVKRNLRHYADALIVGQAARKYTNIE